MNSNTKIGILGGGVEGAALAVYFSGKGFSDICVYDENGAFGVVLPPDVKIVSGVDAFERIYDREFLFRSPGIHVNRLFEAHKKGIEVTSAIRYFFDHCPCKIIGVTGTKGKGTTSTLIYEILKADGRHVFLGGNIGEPPINFLDELAADSIAVLELSSFQLQDLDCSPDAAVVLMTTSDHMDYHADRQEYWDAKKQVMIHQEEGDFTVLNADYEYSDEFIRYGDGEKFLVSRKNRVERGAFVEDGMIRLVGLGGEQTGQTGQTGQTPDELRTSGVGLGADELRTSGVGLGAVELRTSGVGLGAVELRTSGVGLEAIALRVDEVGLLGGHNLENVMAACVVAMEFGVSIEVVRRAVAEFKGLPHRLEFVREVDGVNYYNDSFSTTPETSIAGACAFDSGVLLIAGGSEKNSDYTEWARALQANDNVKMVFLIGEVAERMEVALREAGEEMGKASMGLTPDELRTSGVGLQDGAGVGLQDGVWVEIYRCDGLEEALEMARTRAVKGDNVVMSPAAASFGLFKNYKIRGETFRKIVNEM